MRELIFYVWRLKYNLSISVVELIHLWIEDFIYAIYEIEIYNMYNFHIQYIISLGRAWASPTVMWLTEMKRNALWCVRTRNFSTVIKSHRHATGTSASLLLTCQLCFQVHNFCVNLHGFAFRKTLHISQDTSHFARRNLLAELVE